MIWREELVLASWFLMKFKGARIRLQTWEALETFWVRL